MRSTVVDNGQEDPEGERAAHPKDDYAPGADVIDELREAGSHENAGEPMVGAEDNAYRRRIKAQATILNRQCEKEREKDAVREKLQRERKVIPDGD